MPHELRIAIPYILIFLLGLIGVRKVQIEDGLLIFQSMVNYQRKRSSAMIFQR